MATEMVEVSNRVNFGSWVGRLTCPEKSGQREYPMISGLVRKKRYGIQCPENIGPASTWYYMGVGETSFNNRFTHLAGARPMVKGHASNVPDEELQYNDGMLWYLPHHGVSHPRTKQLSIVLDASAHFAGTSLNDCLLSGPDLTNNLIGVLLCFKQEPVAMMPDLECMFYQIKMPHSERHLLRFLWWPIGDPSNDVIECHMHTHIFGATSSPAVASYALRKTALDNSTEFSPDAMNTIPESFYVDDCLKAVARVDEAISLSAELRSLTQKGGFRLAGWVSNSHDVIESIPHSESSKNITNIDLMTTSPQRKRLVSCGKLILTVSASASVYLRNLLQKESCLPSVPCMIP